MNLQTSSFLPDFESGSHKEILAAIFGSFNLYGYFKPKMALVLLLSEPGHPYQMLKFVPFFNN